MAQIVPKADYKNLFSQKFYVSYSMDERALSRGLKLSNFFGK
jgi:hypothetical protein